MGTHGVTGRYFRVEIAHLEICKKEFKKAF